MSFFTSESGGPGMAVGMLVLILVGVGGGALLQGRFKGTSDRAKLREQLEVSERTRDHLQQQVNGVQSQWDKGQALIATHKEWEALGESLKKSRPRAEELSEQKQKLAADIAGLQKEYDDYRTKYLRQIRNAAVGEKLDELSSRQGKVYRGVMIKRVTEAGMEFTHADGLASLKPNELADSWGERFHW